MTPISRIFYHFHMYLYFSTITLNQLFFNDTSISPKYSFKYPSLPSIFFSLPTQEFFRGQGKIKVGTETGNTR